MKVSQRSNSFSLPSFCTGNGIAVPNIITNAVAGTRRSTPSTAAMRPVIAARTESAFGASKGAAGNELFVDLVEQMTVLFGAGVSNSEEIGDKRGECRRWDGIYAHHY